MESEKPQEKQAQLDPQTKTLDLSPPVVASSEDLPPSARIQNPNLSPSTSLPKQQLEDAVESHKEDANPGEQKAAKTASASVEATGTESNLQKKLRRAERFGVAVMLSEEEKRNTRAERFGTGSTSPQATGTGQLEEQKRKARAERFGITVHPPPNEEAKKKARVERFAANPKINSLEEEKRKARAIRFAQTPGASSQENVKDNSELVPVLWLLKLMFAVGKHMGVRHLEAQYWPSYNEVMPTMGTSAGAIANDM